MTNRLIDGICHKIKILRECRGFGLISVDKIFESGFSGMDDF